MKKGSHIQTGVFYAAFIGGGGEPDHSGGSEVLQGRKNALYPLIIGHLWVGLYAKYKAVRTGVEPVDTSRKSNKEGEL